MLKLKTCPQSIKIETKHIFDLIKVSQTRRIIYFCVLNFFTTKGGNEMLEKIAFCKVWYFITL
jgi:hypothetical protein